jgi:peptide/nickel transport system substrate-binding protein
LVQSEQELAEEQVLRIAFDAADLRSLDPHTVHPTMDKAVVDMVFDGLIRYKPGDITVIEPDIAEAWEMSPDGLVWTFQLRKGVMCHPFPGYPDGYELTSEDVVYSLRRAADPDKSAHAGEYVGMTFEAVDKYTVKITLQKPLSPTLFLPKLIDQFGGLILCKKAVEALGDEAIKTHPVGTGPFMFKEYIPMEKTVLVRNEKYWRGVPILEKVEVWYIPDLSAREMALIAAEIEAFEGPPDQPWAEKMMATPGIVVDIFSPGETTVLHLNTTKEPLDDLRVRKALAYCIDRYEVTATVGELIAEPIYSFVPIYLAGGMTKEEVAAAGLLYEVDREKAKALLAEAGYPEGFSLEVVTSEKGEYHLPMVNIQAQLRKCNVDVKLKMVDHPTMHVLIREDVNPMVLYVCWRPSADAYLYRFFHSNSRVVVGKKPDTNFSHYTAIDDLIEAAREELDPKKQIALWKEAQIKILEDMVAHGLFIKKFVYPRRDYVNWGYELKSTIQLYPQINELTRILKH